MSVLVLRLQYPRHEHHEHLTSPTRDSWRALPPLRCDEPRGTRETHGVGGSLRPGELLDVWSQVRDLPGADHRGVARRRPGALTDVRRPHAAAAVSSRRACAASEQPRRGPRVAGAGLGTSGRNLKRLTAPTCLTPGV